MDIPIPYTAEEIDAAKAQALQASGLEDAYVRAFCWRGSGSDMGVAAAANPVHMAVAVWSWGAYYGDAKFQGAKLDISKWRRPSPETNAAARDASSLNTTTRSQGPISRRRTRSQSVTGMLASGQYRMLSPCRTCTPTNGSIARHRSTSRNRSSGMKCLA